MNKVTPEEIFAAFKRTIGPDDTRFNFPETWVDLDEERKAKFCKWAFELNLVLSEMIIAE